LRIHLAEQLLDAGCFDDAEELLRTGLQSDPASVELLVCLARVYHAQGKNSAALVALEEALERPMSDPDAGAAYMLYSRVLLASGMVKEAVDAFRRGEELDPEHVDGDLRDRLGMAGGADTDGVNGEVVEGRLRGFAEEPEDDPFIEVAERPAITFADVGGMESVKDEIRMKIILPLTNKDLYAAYGKTIGGGILMYGPPGCGKTHLARATAGEINADFISVGLQDVLDMWIGQSEQKLHQLFQQARRHTPCVLFFDEVDALAASRTDMKRSAGRHVINQFLSELDGIDASNEGVLILAATNAPWHLDSAFRRPGRFDRIVFVPPPDLPARAEILHIHLKNKPTETIDYSKLARKTEGYSGADLKALIDIAVEDTLKQAMKTGKPLPISTKAILQTMARQKNSTVDWFSTARNYALFSNEGGIYDDILDYLDMKR
jgi:AAA+ superfamily predicted ATPase